MKTNTVKKSVSKLLIPGLLMGLLPTITFAAESSGKENTGKFYGDFRLRYETAKQNNGLEDAEGLTLRSRVGYITPSLNGFSAQIEIEDSRAIIDDFAVPPSGFNTGEFSVIADPDSNTEVDQAFVKYVSPLATFKLGRQVVVRDNHRFIGHVGWRQDRQTFDALNVDFSPAKDLNIKYTYIDQRNRIFSDDADVDAKDHLINASYKTPYGKLTAYSYLLEADNDTDNGLDSYGIRFAGKSGKYWYAAEFATQEFTGGGNEFDADYFSLAGSVNLGPVTAKAGFESLGSDDGQFGFSTPLATLHKFNGWADVFLNTPDQGLEDAYVSLSGKVFGGKWAAVYHDFSSDVSLNGSDDLGSEIDLLFVKKFGKRYTAGIKFADYEAGSSAFSTVDTQRFWVWLSAKI